MVDLFRAGETAADVAEMENAANLRHAADTASQIEDLQTAARVGGDEGEKADLLRRFGIGGDIGNEVPPGLGAVNVEAGAANPFPLTLDSVADLDVNNPVHGQIDADILAALQAADEAAAQGDMTRHAQLMEEVESLNALRLAMVEDPDFTAGTVASNTANVDVPYSPQVAGMMDVADQMEDPVQAEALRMAARRMHDQDVFTLLPWFLRHGRRVEQNDSPI